MLCKCLGPLEFLKLYTVRAVTFTPAVVVLTVNRLFADLGQNAPFRLCIVRGVLPRNNTGVVLVTDGVITLPVRGFNGNFLRNDSLHDFVCRHAHKSCSSVVLNAFKGNDDPHVTIFNRMCASSFATAEEAPSLDAVALSAATATKKAASATKE